MNISKKSYTVVAVRIISRKGFHGQCKKKMLHSQSKDLPTKWIKVNDKNKFGVIFSISSLNTVCYNICCWCPTLLRTGLIQWAPCSNGPIIYFWIVTNPIIILFVYATTRQFSHLKTDLNSSNINCYVRIISVKYKLFSWLLLFSCLLRIIGVFVYIVFRFVLHCECVLCSNISESINWYYWDASIRAANRIQN